MKHIYIYITILVFLFVPANNVLAQKETQKYNGQSYIYDFQNEKVYRSQVSVYGIANNFSEKFTAKSPCSITDMFKGLFTKKRLEELKSEKVVIKFICNYTGNVMSVEFLFFKKPFLSKWEIALLEKTCCNYKFKIYSEDKDTKLYKFAMSCFFKNLL